MALVLITAGTSFAFGPGVILKMLIDPASYIGAGVVVAGLYGIWLQVEGKFKESKKVAEAADLKASIAAIAAINVSQQTESNSQRNDVLEDQIRFIQIAQSGQQHLIDDLQQERDTSKAETAELKQQLREAVKEIQILLRELTDLKAQLREITRENVADKQEITLLRARVNALEMEVARLTVENSHLLEENRDLKTGIDQGLRRRGSDMLTGLPSDIQREFEALNSQPQPAANPNQPPHPQDQSWESGRSGGAELLSKDKDKGKKEG